MRSQIFATVALSVAGVLASACGSSSPTAPTPPPVTIISPPVVIPPPVVVVNPLLTDPRFDLTFYRQFVTRPLYRWAQAPRVYLRTIDDGGRTVDPRLLDQTAAAIINTTGAWTGGAFGIAAMERGTDTRQGQTGWITVAWNTSPAACGTTTLTGATATQTITHNIIVLNHVLPGCTCGPRVAKHELGHAMGYSHTDSPNDLMIASFQDICDKDLSAREKFHAQVAYSLPSGSMEP